MGGDGIRARKGRQSRLRPSGSATVERAAIERPLKIGEAAKLIGVEAYVLRFWETQFSCIRPKQSRSGHRSYTLSDVETLKIVKHLLHTQRYTIAGARRFIREKGLDGIRNPFSGPSRVGAGRSVEEQLDAVSATSTGNTLVTAKGNGVRELREIREDLRALHKLLATC